MVETRGRALGCLRRHADSTAQPLRELEAIAHREIRGRQLRGPGRTAAVHPRGLQSRRARGQHIQVRIIADIDEFPGRQREVRGEALEALPRGLGRPELARVERDG